VDATTAINSTISQECPSWMQPQPTAPLSHRSVLPGCNRSHQLHYLTGVSFLDATAAINSTISQECPSWMQPQPTAPLSHRSVLPGCNHSHQLHYLIRHSHSTGHSCVCYGMHQSYGSIIQTHVSTLSKYIYLHCNLACVTKNTKSNLARMS